MTIMIRSITFDAYLNSLSAEKRAVLQKMRKVIQAAVPVAQEGSSYGLPAFLVNGKAVAALSASKKHCCYFPMSGHVVAAHSNELKGYDTSKGTIRFSPDKPLPATLVRKLVKARLAEIAKRKTVKKLPSSARIARLRVSPDRSLQIDPAVVAFLQNLDHPLKKAIETIRKILLSVSPTIHEGIKWNAPSFRTADYFATFNLRSTDAVQLILHTGAKVKETAPIGIQIDDPDGMLNWLAKDRCMVMLGVGKDFHERCKALAEVVKQWIKYIH